MLFNEQVNRVAPTLGLEFFGILIMEKKYGLTARPCLTDWSTCSQHVNENNAVHVALNILRDPKCNFIESWTEDEQHEFRSTVIQLVLGSDTDSHFELFTRFQMRVNTGTEGYSGSLAAAFYRGCDHKTRLLILQLVVVCAMHGDAVLPFEVHKKWVQMKQDELFGQGDEELQLGLPISGLMDRQRPGIADRTAQVQCFYHIPAQFCRD